jgi:hypothetical protein
MTKRILIVEAQEDLRGVLRDSSCRGASSRYQYASYQDGSF